MSRNSTQRRAARATTGAQRRSAGRGEGAAFFRPSPSAGAPPPPSPEERQRELRERARDLVHLARWAIGHDPQTEEIALSGLVQLATSSAAGGRAVGRQLDGQLREQLGLAWRRGWEPSDLHRVVTRAVRGGGRGPAPEQEVLADVMAAELAGYATGTVEPRWHGQLAELGADTWWPASDDPLTARATTGHAGWGRVCPAALRVLALVGRLPEIGVLGALPGQADPAAQDAAERASKVDERILRRVRALLAKAESTTYEAEAETFTAGAQAMMARHSIDVAMLDASAQDDGHTRTGPGAIRIGIDRPYESPRAFLLERVAGANRCRTVWAKELGFATVLGFPPDLRAVETLFTSLMVQSTAAMHREGSRPMSGGRSRTRAFRQSFLSAYAARIGERLAEVAREEEDQARRQGPTGPDAPGGDRPAPTGAELVPVLAARSRQVDEATAAMFPDLVVRRTGRVSDAEGWHRGRAAADQATLAAFEALPAGA